MQTREVKTRNGKKRLSPELKMEIVREYHLEGKRNKSRLAQEYGIGQATVCDILRNFAAENDKSALLMKNKPTGSQSEEIKALRKEVLELKKQLYDETMRADFYDTMIDVAEEMFGIEIRKKAGTGQSKGCTGTSGTK
jgi:transposase-like protein